MAALPDTYPDLSKIDLETQKVPEEAMPPSRPGKSTLIWFVGLILGLGVIIFLASLKRADAAELVLSLS
jgi:hypothetical protein